jgi:hypothetical protein
MASVQREIDVEVSAAEAWRAIRDVGRAHALFAGVLVDCRLEDGLRTVTFANGLVARERIVDVDEARRRLAYAVVGSERLLHHHATLQVFETAAAACRIAWVADFLPDAMGPAIAALTDQGAAAMRRTLEVRRP